MPRFAGINTVLTCETLRDGQHKAWYFWLILVVLFMDSTFLEKLIKIKEKLHLQLQILNKKQE